MDVKDAIVEALTPGSMFNQKSKVWRSVGVLAQFADENQAMILETLQQHFQGLVQIKPSVKHPENGPLVALYEHIVEGAGPIKIIGGPAVFAAAGAAQVDVEPKEEIGDIDTLAEEEDSPEDVAGEVAALNTEEMVATDVQSIPGKVSEEGG